MVDPSPQPHPTPDQEFVWSYRGYHLRSSEFTTAMVHFFRAEVQRANVWRQRLDTTTNWAVISTGATISLAFSPSGSHHSVIFLNTLLITMFLFIEARRYRYYELWSGRVRLMETDFFAAMLVPPFGPAADWAENLAESMLQPHFPISLWEAVGRRYRRNYLWIFLLLFLAWLFRVGMLPEAVTSMTQFWQNAAVGPLPGQVVFAIFSAYILFWGVVGVMTSGMREASGEVLPRYDVATDDLIGEYRPNDADQHDTVSAVGGASWQAWFRHGQRRRQLLALIITAQGETVAARVLADLKRGVTGIDGRGMYTGKGHTVLLCALTVTEVNHLKAIVNEADSNAFVIVTPAQEVLGRGFVPLKK